MGFKRSCSLLTFASTMLAASAGADVIEVEVGEFRFLGFENLFEYSGEFGDYVGPAWDGSTPTTVGEIQVGQIGIDLELGPIAWIRISGPDTETSQVNPGADIDLFAIDGLPHGIQSHYVYEGPNPLYQNMPSELIAQEVSTLDFVPGDVDDDPSFVSLGISGSMIMLFEGIGDGSDDQGGSGDDGNGGGGPGDVDNGWPQSAFPNLDPTLWSTNGRSWTGGLDTEAAFHGVGGESLLLRINEIAPIPENVTVHIAFMNMVTPVPGPAAGLLFAGVAGIRRRRCR
ncbi:MAG: hypothetical protein MK085_03255 [Phycisphaerales bacterium]|nr:hypothetical protein [Phycisphaerales bacterium]